MRIRGTLAQCETDSPTPRRGTMTRSRKPRIAALLLVGMIGIVQAQAQDSDDAFLPSPVRTVSTTPANGDQNPYGVAFIPNNFPTGSGPLKHGDILVSNFNNSQNQQGTGTTIVRVPAGGQPAVFFQGNAGLGLSTALGMLQHGFVVVGNAPTTDGTSATAQPGSLLVINNQGKLIQTITDATIQFPWDMALIDEGNQAIAFVTNALTGTVSRLTFEVGSNGLKLLNAKIIASGYVHQGDPVALFDAPTGLVYDFQLNLLYVASTGDNAVFAISDPVTRSSDGGRGFIVYRDEVHLHGPLAMAAAPNGHLLVSNNDTVNPDPNQTSEIVEFTKDGRFVKELSVDPSPGGSFGLAVNVKGDQATFAAVDDNTASLIVWTLGLD